MMSLKMKAICISILVRILRHNQQAID